MMPQVPAQLGRELLKPLLRRYRRPMWLVLGASVLLNLMVFAASLYMMLVYDTVLPSRSGATLVGLFAMIALVYLLQMLFETMRAEALLGVANGVHDDLYPVVHRATVVRSLRMGADRGDGLQWVRDLDAVHGWLAGAGPVALIDLPWVVVFLLVLALLHYWLGLAALAGVVILALIALASSRRTHDHSRALYGVTGRRAAATISEIRTNESALAMGMQARLAERTGALETDFLAAQSALSRTVARFGGAGRTFRIFLQSAILTVGAFLVIDDQATGGIIIASSVLAGRALAPVDAAIGNWRAMTAARDGWNRIAAALADFPMPGAPSVALEAPAGKLDLRDVWIAPPGSDRAVITGVSLSVEPGQALALIGPSASGKSTLVRALLGIWQPVRGEVRIDGALHAQWDADVLGRHLGYVPQVVELSGGTIGQNIARFSPDASSESIIAAARSAGMHEAILAMPGGYDRMLGEGAPELSAGQRQRVGLARALYGEPFLLVLDEANSNLDAAGDAALTRAVFEVRQRGGIVVMVTHRPATLAPVTHVAVLREGRIADYGERDAVLERSAGGVQPRTAASLAETPQKTEAIARIEGSDA